MAEIMSTHDEEPDPVGSSSGVRRSFTVEYKMAVLKELETVKSINKVARANGIARRNLLRWQNEKDDLEKLMSCDGVVQRKRIRKGTDVQESLARMPEMERRLADWMKKEREGCRFGSSHHSHYLVTFVLSLNWRVIS
mgnify:CR=1 FL=1